MVATRDAYQAMWEREYAAALGCEFCDPALMAQQLAALRRRLEPVDDPSDEESQVDDPEDGDDADVNDEALPYQPAQMR